MRPGLAFQNLTAIIERAFSTDAHTKVESPKYLPELALGMLREFDVVITFSKGHHTNITALECKDYKRPVSIGTVDEFKAKCGDCGVNRGILVSSSGFTKAARKKAASKGIECMTLKEAEADDWLTPAVSLQHRVVYFQRIFYDIAGDEPLAEPFKAYAQDGGEVTFKGLGNFANRIVPGPSDKEIETGQDSYEVGYPGSAGIYIIDATGKRFDPVSLSFLITCTYSREDVPLDLKTYEGGGKSYGIASADAVSGSTKSKLLFVRDEEGLKFGVVPLTKVRP